MYGYTVRSWVRYVAEIDFPIAATDIGSAGDCAVDEGNGDISARDGIIVVVNNEDCCRKGSE